MSLKSKIINKIRQVLLYRMVFKHRGSMAYWRIDDINTMWYYYDVFKSHLDWAYSAIGKEYSQVINDKVRINDTIFVYWRQGFEKAPDIVKKCLESLKGNAHGHPVVILTGENLHDYITLPAKIEELHNKGILQEANYSDLVRTNLLIRYGGYWFDATCFLSSKIPDNIEKADFFMFNRDLLEGFVSPLECSSWFIKSNKDNELLVRLQTFLFHYFEHNSRVVHYFIYHIALSVLVNEDEKCRQIWENKPYICTMNPHALLFHFSKKFIKPNYEQILKFSFVHKLTYKFDKNLLKAKETNYLQYFLKNN